MQNLIKAGQWMFATGMAGLGLLGIVYKDFIIGRPPAWPKEINFNPVLAYISAMVIISAAIALIIIKKPVIAAYTIAFLVLVLSISRHIPFFDPDHLNAYKTLALLGGALIIACSFIETNVFVLPEFIQKNKTRSNIIFIGCLLLAAFFILAGYAHFKFADFVNQFIPAYIPFHPFWTYSCGICLVAGGIGLILPQTRKWAALLSGIMITGWFLLLHIPRFFGNMQDASDRMGLCESFAFAGVCFCLAGMCAKKRTRLTDIP